MFRRFGSSWGRLIARSASPSGDRSTKLIDDLEQGRAIPDDLVDAVLNEEIGDDVAGAIFDAIRRDGDAMRELEETEYAIDALKGATPGAPDLSSQILQGVDRKSGLLSSRAVRSVFHWRTAAVLGLIAGAAALFSAHRMLPEGAQFSTDPAPIRDLVRLVPTEGFSQPVLFSDVDNLSIGEQFYAVATVGAGADTPVCSDGDDSFVESCCPYSQLLLATSPATLAMDWIEDASALTADFAACGICPIADEGSGYETVRGRFIGEGAVEDASGSGRGVRVFKR